MEKTTTARADPIIPRKRSGISSALGMAVLAGLCVGASFFFDAAVERWVVAHRDPAWEAVAKVISRFCAWHWLMGFALVGLVVSWLRRLPEWVRILAAMMIASSIAGLSADCIRGLTGRTRPNADAPQGWYGMRHDSMWLVGRHAYNAFPSGHTAAATAFAAVAWFSHRKRGALLLLMAAAVGASRIYLGNHHFSDVITGALLGAGVAAWVWLRLMKKLRWGSNPLGA